MRCLGKHCTNREANAFAGRDSNLLATPNGLDLTGSNLTQSPGAKAHQTHLVALCDILAYHFGESFKNFAGLFQVQTCSCSDLMDQFVFANHGSTLVG